MDVSVFDFLIIYDVIQIRTHWKHCDYIKIIKSNLLSFQLLTILVKGNSGKLFCEFKKSFKGFVNYGVG